MDDEKIASIKLVSGEEIICILVEILENTPYSTIVIENPMLLSFETSRRSEKKYKISSWLVCDEDRDYYELNIEKIITVTLITNEDLIREYMKYCIPKLKPKPRMLPDKILESSSGFVGSVTDFRKSLESLYNSDSYEKDT